MNILGVSISAKKKEALARLQLLKLKKSIISKYEKYGETIAIKCSYDLYKGKQFNLTSYEDLEIKNIEEKNNVIVYLWIRFVYDEDQYDCLFFVHDNRNMWKQERKNLEIEMILHKHNNLKGIYNAANYINIVN